MGRIYTVTFAGVGVTAAQDVFSVTAATGKPIVLREIFVGQYSDVGDAASEILSIIIKRGVGATIGSGGSAATPAKAQSIDAAASATARINDTTPTAAGGGTLTTLRAETLNIFPGYRYQPLPGTELVFAPAEICAVVITAPADSLTMSGTLVFEELN